MGLLATPTVFHEQAFFCHILEQAKKLHLPKGQVMPTCGQVRRILWVKFSFYMLVEACFVHASWSFARCWARGERPVARRIVIDNLRVDNLQLRRPLVGPAVVRPQAPSQVLEP